MILSLLLNFIVLTNCLHSRIKHYPSVTEDKCGINRQSLLMSGHCFKWSSNVGTNVQNGRLAQPLEWPWIAFIDFYKTFLGLRYNWYWCTGVILNSYWIITAAHCIKSDYTLSVKLGNDYSHESHVYGVDMYVIHPNYTAYNHIKGFNKGYDIALLKLDSQILMTQSTGGYPTVNAICLPDRDIVNTDKELAVFAGFGDIEDNVINSGPLRTGWLQMTESSKNSTDNYSYLILSKRYPLIEGTGGCQGDSGGPLVQYVMDNNNSHKGVMTSSGGSGGGGRAVLIGIIRSVYPMSTTCQSKHSDAISIFVRISKHIDWIINTVSAK
ncbi:elastase-1-like [Oppia nitens]|uniref:elastase-1-like n=1 Tax=Oppia nitens TaxID=1686743 RepID=UPI0023DB20A8|nr:elastase-1-like [Oppia nitens]